MGRLVALGELVVHEIRARVQEATGGLTTSAGIGPTFMLAKVGGRTCRACCHCTSAVAALRKPPFYSLQCTSTRTLLPSMLSRRSPQVAADQRKPNGQFCIGARRDEVLAFLAPLPTRKVPGIGRVQVIVTLVWHEA